MTKLEVLKKYFGFDEFRAIQEEAIDKILQKNDLLTILPTGSGKSLIYQLPTLLMDGVTIVISPLIALMQDQIASLHANGISAGMMSSINTNEENDTIFQELSSGQLKFLYVAPERFTQEYFIQSLQNININFFVIDEAHCVSEWGHEFRDDYRKLQYLKNNFPATAITAFTATATKNVEKDILKTLGISNDNLLRAKIQRTNLLIRSQKRLGNGKEQIIEFLNTHKDECGIVYCFTRKETEQVSGYLNNSGFDTLAYHAGLPSNTRDDIFKKFKNESVKIIVATIAFGMGIDKGNIRFVLHTSMPKTLENYSQEIGRAGRDGLNADVLLLYAKADELGKKRFIDELPDSSYKQSNYKKLESMYRFCISSKCRHQLIASYFDDTIDECKIICDNCIGENKEYTNITIEAQKFISAVLRTEERFGQTYVIDVLRGSKVKRILDFEHDNLSVYGIGKDLSKEQWSIIADTLLDMEAITVNGEYRTLNITDVARKILKKEIEVTIDSANLNTQKNYKEYKQDIITDEVFERFRTLRTSIAKSEQIAPYLVFGDKTLSEISSTMPTNKTEFLSILGIGELKYDKYFDIFHELVQEIREEKNTSKENDSINEKEIQTPKENQALSKTYLETLLLIENNNSLDEICLQRELKENTIMNHIVMLEENSYINKETKNRLFSHLIDEFPIEIKEWIEKGFDIADLHVLRQSISKYAYLF